MPLQALAPVIRPRRSMRRFLAWWMAALLGVLSLVDLAASYPQSAHQLDEARDKALARVAAGYLRSLRAPDADTSRIPASVFREELGLEEPPPLRFRISNGNGERLGGDERIKPPSPGAGDGVLQAGLYGETVDGQAYRVAVVRDAVAKGSPGQPLVVQVAEPMADRAVARRNLLHSLVARQLLRLALLLAAFWAVAQLGLQPLTALCEELKQRRVQELSRVSEQRPEELKPLVHIINELLSAQQASIDQQRRFLADASHQLRTPLAVLRTQLQGLLGGQTAASETLPKMLQTIDRASVLANQLLCMAKVEQLVRRADWVDVDLDEVTREIALEFAPLIARKRLDFSLQSAPLRLRTDPWLLGELVRNLLSNAIHHSKKGAALGIVVRQLRHEAEMVVWDHGGGVAEDVRERLFEPFNAAKGGTGIGLGLSICRQIADSMTASVDLFNRIEAGQVLGVDAVVRWPQVTGAEAFEARAAYRPAPVREVASPSETEVPQHG